MSSTEQEHIKKAIDIATDILEQHTDMHIQNEIIDAIRTTILDNRRRSIEEYESKIQQIREASGI